MRTIRNLFRVIGENMDQVLFQMETKRRPRKKSVKFRPAKVNVVSIVIRYI